MAQFDGAEVRLFFAAVPDQPTRTRLGAAADALPWDSAAKRVPPEDYHATLAFVGEVPAGALSVLKEIAARQSGAAFALNFDAYEYWPKPEVVVAAARAVPPALVRLWTQLHGELGVHGWAIDPKRLRPHVTLARKVPQAPVLPVLSGFAWKVDGFSLMRSNGGALPSTYTVLDTWRLLDTVGDAAKSP